MKKIFTLLLVITCFKTVGAQVPTWSDTIANILYTNCTSCHHPGGIAPFSLMTYTDAVTYSPGIQTAVTSHLMPPWKPDPNYRHFKGERKLSQDEINKINDWINNGTPSGNLGNAPAPPVYTTGSQMPVIDQTLQIPTFTVTQTVDQYRSFVIHSGNTVGKYLNKVEFLPGNNSIVHHILLYYDPSAVSFNLDQADPLPGFASNGTMPLSPNAVTIGAWAPGAGIYELPPNFGHLVPANADYVIEVHYAPGSNGQSDSTQVNLKFTTVPGVRQVYVEPVLEYFTGMIDGPLFIPANTVQTFHEQFYNSFGNISLFSVFPHMHKIGVSFKSRATKLLDTIPLIYIPQWDFHWQGFYQYQKVIKLPSQYTIWAEATYDNTGGNPNNPSNPPVDVSAGEQTTDEMMIGFFAFAFYQPGDENIILDSSIISGIDDPQMQQLLFTLSPNPANDNVEINYVMKQNADATIEVYDLQGKLQQSVKTKSAAGYNNYQLNTMLLTDGIYVVKLLSSQKTYTQKLLVQH
ncbi:MAG: T9SS type A sorting domain-containing protein [Chitinophagales bacterium]